MRTSEIDRICSATLQGRFGPSLISPREIDQYTGASDPSHGAFVTIRNAAVWTTARAGTEQGKR